MISATRLSLQLVCLLLWVFLEETSSYSSPELQEQVRQTAKPGNISHRGLVVLRGCRESPAAVRSLGLCPIVAFVASALTDPWYEVLPEHAGGVEYRTEETSLGGGSPQRNALILSDFPYLRRLEMS